MSSSTLVEERVTMGLLGGSYPTHRKVPVHIRKDICCQVTDNKLKLVTRWKKGLEVSMSLTSQNTVNVLMLSSVFKFCILFIVKLKLLEESLYGIKLKFVIHTKPRSCSLKLMLQYSPCSATATLSKAKNNRIYVTTAETLQTSPGEVTWTPTETKQISSKT